MWFFPSDPNGKSRAANILDFSTSFVFTRNSSAHRTSAINNYALTINCNELSGEDNLKSLYSVLVQFTLQSISVTSPDCVALSSNIAGACFSLHLLLQKSNLNIPISRLICQGLQGVFECLEFLKSSEETIRVFCHEMLHAVFDRTVIPLLDSDSFLCLHSQRKFNSALTFQHVFRTISSCFPYEILKELEFLTFTRMFAAHSEDVLLSAATRRSHYKNFATLCFSASRRR
jgi:hypothetical protein